MAARAPNSLLRAAGWAWERASQSAGLQRRLLSTTQPRQATHVISFDQTSSPELDKVLNTIREEIILPSYIPKDQRKKLHRLRYKQKLESDPVTLEIDGEVKRFRYRHPFMSGLPNTRDTMADAVLEMRTREDFENLPRLYAGIIVVADRKIPLADRVRMVRRAGQYGCIDIVLRMARNAKTWGFKLDHPELVAELLAQLQVRAVDADWDPEVTKIALRDTDTVIELLEQPTHQPKRTEDGGGGMMGKKGYESLTGFSRWPQFLAPRLHMAAVMAVKHNDGKDVDGNVDRFARKVLGKWAKSKGFLGLYDGEAYTERDRQKYLMDKNNYLYHISPILHGLRLAEQVVDSNLAAELRTRADVLEQEVSDARTPEVIERNGRGIQMYNKLFDSDGKPRQ